MSDLSGMGGIVVQSGATLNLYYGVMQPIVRKMIDEATAPLKEQIMSLQQEADRVATEVEETKAKNEQLFAALQPVATAVNNMAGAITGLRAALDEAIANAGNTAAVEASLKTAGDKLDALQGETQAAVDSLSTVVNTANAALAAAQGPSGG